MIFQRLAVYNFSNQGVWLLTFKIKESQWKLRRAKLKPAKIMHLFINPCFYFGSGGLYPLKNCSKCRYTRYYVVFHWSLDWGLKVCILILLISFKLDLKLVYTPKKRNEWTICHLFSGRRHSHNPVSRRLHSSNRIRTRIPLYFTTRNEDSLFILSAWLFIED